MKILLARKLGMCFGVRRALDIAEKAAKARKKGSNIYMYGPLVHNKNVIELLEAEGIKTIKTLPQAEKGSSVIIRAHGASDKDLLDAKLRQISIIDATCPYVQKSKNAAKQMEKEGFKVVILGQKEHPEVKGIAESLNNPMIINSAAEIKQLNGIDRIGIISQTTQSHAELKRLVSALRKKGGLIKVEDTICNATSERQSSALSVAKNAGIMLVVGDKSSANTKKLAELCSEVTATRQIECASDLKEEWFADAESVGITAGASTPKSVVDGVVEWLSRSQKE